MVKKDWFMEEKSKRKLQKKILEDESPGTKESEKQEKEGRRVKKLLN
jgi:hypothetical protein